MPTTNKERRQYVQDFEASGLTPTIFCNKNNLNRKTFHAWRKRFAGNLSSSDSLDPLKSAPLKPSNLKPATFLPINVVDDSKSSPFEGTHAIPLSFKTKNFCLEFPLNAQENFADFKLILQALHELC